MTRARAAGVGLALLVGALVAGCEDRPARARPAPDAGVLEPGTDGGGATTADAGSAPATGGLAIRLSTDGACRDLGVAHVDEPLFGFEVTGPPGEWIEIWASRPQCGAAPFYYSGVELDASGRGTLVRHHPGTSACDDGLIGGWTVFAAEGSSRSAPVELVFVNGACASGPSCADAAAHCPAPATSP